MEFRTVQGDIAQQKADALVNAAGTTLQMGSGVAGALRRTAGGPINEEAVSKGPVDLGAVAVTEAYELDADHVIHAAAMPHYGDGQATRDSIALATENALDAAEELDCESVVIPVLGTGAASFEFAEGTRIVCETIRNYEADGLTDVRVIAYSDGEYAELEQIADDVKST